MLQTLCMDAKQMVLWNRIEKFEMPKGFKERLANENSWSLEKAEDEIQEYKKFMFLATQKASTPTKNVDEVWHLHLIYTKSYWNEFCKNVLQKDIHHNPGEEESDDVIFERQFSETLEAREFHFGKRKEKLFDKTAVALSFLSLLFLGASAILPFFMIFLAIFCASLVIYLVVNKRKRESKRLEREEKSWSKEIEKKIEHNKIIVDKKQYDAIKRKPISKSDKKQSSSRNSSNHTQNNDHYFFAACSSCSSSHNNPNTHNAGCTSNDANSDGHDSGSSDSGSSDSGSGSSCSSCSSGSSCSSSSCGSSCGGGCSS